MNTSVKIKDINGLATKITKFTAGVLVGLLLAGNVWAAGGGSGDYRLDKAYTKITDIDSLRRGAIIFAQNCVACHSAQYMRYSRIGEDLKWDNEELRKNMGVTGSVFDAIASPLTEEAAVEAYGVLPPDLSLRAKVRGLDWMLSYLKGYYQDENSPTGFNNAIYPDTAMSNVLAALQGIQEPVYKEANGEQVLVDVKLASPGIMTRKEFHNAMTDLVNFMDYMSEPAKLQRVQLGWKVMLFLLILIFLTYLVKREYWRDVT